MKTLTADEIAAFAESPETATLRISPQLLVEMMGAAYVRPDGRVVRMIEVQQYDDGELMPLFKTTGETAVVSSGRVE